MRGPRTSLGVLAAAAALATSGCGGGAAAPRSSAPVPRVEAASPAARPPRRPIPRPAPHPVAYGVGLKVLHLVDRSRTIILPGGRREARPLRTVLRYPTAAGPPSVDSAGARPARGPFPLIVFGHGFTVSPVPYARLLRAWTAAGYVVAAPVFPLENGAAPGGPNENDLVNQPTDVSFVISQLLRQSRASGRPVSGLIAAGRIAVSGQSDGGETALAVAYDRLYLDRRVRAAVILSGAKIPGLRGFTFPPGSPPLLAVQGTADTINPPSFTAAFFNIAPRPKYLVELLGAGHLPPYVDQQPQLGIVERASIAFLDGYLRHRSGAWARLHRAATVSGVARLLAFP